MSSDPLIVAETTRMGQTGKEVHVTCREPAPCLSATVHGTTLVVNAAVDRLEAIHQSAHALRGDET